MYSKRFLHLAENTDANSVKPNTDVLTILKNHNEN
jgi:hypothetical protein